VTMKTHGHSLVMSISDDKIPSLDNSIRNVCASAKIKNWKVAPCNCSQLQQGQSKYPSRYSNWRTV